MSVSSNSPSDKNGSSKPSDRVGRALIKYLKPIKVVLPHYFPWQSSGKSAREQDSLDRASSQQKFDEFSKLAAEAERSDLLAQSKTKDEDSLAVQMAGPPPKHWLDLVLFLLQACKRVSTKLASKSGVIAYQTMHIAKGRQNIQNKGSIIDTTPLAVSDDDDNDDASGLKKVG